MAIIVRATEWRRQQGSVSDGGTVAKATAAAATNSGDYGSGAKAVVLDRALLSDWAAA